MAGAAAKYYLGAMAHPFSLKTRLSTSFLAQTRNWYRDLFKLEVLEEWDEPGDRGCILGFPGSAGNAYLEIYHSDETHDFSGISLQFRVDDVDAFVVPEEERFASRGPESRPWGSQYLFFSDPNGVTVIVFSGTSL